MPWSDLEAQVLKYPPTRGEMRQVVEYVVRRAKPRFYADEDFPPSASALLRELGARVQTTQEAKQSGRSDESQVAFALRNGLVLLSRDRGYLNERRFPLIHCPAIFVFDFGAGSREDLWRAFRCLALVFIAPQFFDKWCKVDAGRDSWTVRMRYQNGTTSRSRQRLWRGRIQEWVDAKD